MPDNADLHHAARTALACLDLTSLNDADTAVDIDTLCAKAQGLDPQGALRARGAVAAVCVWPRFVAQARALLPASIGVAAVANFPDGALDTARALRDAEAIVAAGGNEVDLVLPYRALLAGQTRECAALVASVRRATTGRTLKLIIESGELKSAAAIRAACELGLAEGVDFLKTSTGKSPVSATPEAARVMLECIAADAGGARVGFKASGGVRRVADAAVYIALVREHLGAAALAPQRLRFGASGLLGDIEAVLSGTTAAPTRGYWKRMLAQEVIRSKRDGGALTPAQIGAFVQGLVDRRWSEGQVAALAMAVCLRGMDRAECVALTRAMTHSGDVLDWRGARLDGPVLDKHSTGGVGDKVSLMLAPIVAACGGVVPMISGRGLGHTGGTLDKLQALPGYAIAPPRATLLRVLRNAGCAIVGASARIAPADRRLYAVRDISATVESVALITASILSKKLAAGLQSLVMDVKVGNGAFCADLPTARTLATSLVEVAHGAGLPTQALITDMNQVLGTTAGNALEVREAIDFLTGTACEARLFELTLALAVRMLCQAGLARDDDDAQQKVQAALASGAAAERFARMVAGLGGPRDVLKAGGADLPHAPVRRPVPALRAGVLAALDTRAIGLAVVALGGGRRRANDVIDPRVGFDAVRALGSAVQAGEPLAFVHAADVVSAEVAVAAVQAAIQIDDEGREIGPVVVERVVAAAA